MQAGHEHCRQQVLSLSTQVPPEEPPDPAAIKRPGEAEVDQISVVYRDDPEATLRRSK